MFSTSSIIFITLLFNFYIYTHSSKEWLKQEKIIRNWLMQRLAKGLFSLKLVLFLVYFSTFSQSAFSQLRTPRFFLSILVPSMFSLSVSESSGSSLHDHFLRLLTKFIFSNSPESFLTFHTLEYKLHTGRDCVFFLVSFMKKQVLYGPFT